MKPPHVEVGDSVVFVTPDGEQLPAIVTAIKSQSVINVTVQVPSPKTVAAGLRILDRHIAFGYELSHYDAEGKEPCSWHLTT